jgi:predicted nucleotidyltransferase component of viral defense system
MAISLEEVRRRILIALFSDDELMETLVLKGGNALALVHKVGSRASLDMDFSIQNAFAELDKTSLRIFNTLKREFGSVGYVVFDEKFDVKPSQPQGQPDWWGGYVVEFKLASKETFEKFQNDIESLRRNSEVLGPRQLRRYNIDISHHEFCEGKVQREFDDYVVYVYSLEMIAAEKLRAICQQMPDYEHLRPNLKRPRARDFYDIYQIIVENGIDLTSPVNVATLRAVFDAKKVPLDLLNNIADHQDFHALDWPSVTASISGKHEPFEVYFAFVVELAFKLHALGVK